MEVLVFSRGVLVSPRFRFSLRYWIRLFPTNLGRFQAHTQVIPAWKVEPSERSRALGAAADPRGPDSPQSSRRELDTAPKTNSRLWEPLIFFTYS